MRLLLIHLGSVVLKKHSNQLLYTLAHLPASDHQLSAIKIRRTVAVMSLYCIFSQCLFSLGIIMLLDKVHSVFLHAVAENGLPGVCLCNLSGELNLLSK